MDEGKALRRMGPQSNMLRSQSP